MTANMFQSTHPHGVRLLLADIRISFPSFQSTHPHGVRHTQISLTCQVLCFNPRTHTGCDAQRITVLITTGYVSIHAPTRGATPRNQSVHRAAVFQSTHPHGVRLACMYVKHSLPTCFNPRTHTGCDVWCKFRAKPTVYVSIHAPTRGATVCKVTYYKSIN